MHFDFQGVIKDMRSKVRCSGVVVSNTESLSFPQSRSGASGGGESRNSSSSGYDPPDYLRPYQRQLDPELRFIHMHPMHGFDPDLYNRVLNSDRLHARSSASNSSSDTNGTSDGMQFSRRRRDDNHDHVVGRPHMAFRRFEPSMFDEGGDNNTRTAAAAAVDGDGPNHSNSSSNNNNNNNDDEEDEVENSEHPPRPPRPQAPRLLFTPSCWGYFCDGSTGVHAHCDRRGTTRDTISNDSTPDLHRNSSATSG